MLTLIAEQSLNERIFHFEHLTIWQHKRQKQSNNKVKRRIVQEHKNEVCTGCICIYLVLFRFTIKLVNLLTTKAYTSLQATRYDFLDTKRLSKFSDLRCFIEHILSLRFTTLRL